jgi:ribosome-interacting GTPase 1
MPANLPPQYFEIEKRLKATTDPDDRIAIMEELLSIIPKHKGTEKLQAMYKTKISKLRSSSQKKAAKSKHGSSHKIKKSGAGQVVLIGPPNSGKSALVESLTDIKLQVSDYPFTTTAAFPAMLKYENIQIQLVDTPPITPDYMEIWYPDLIKSSDAVLLLIDPTSSSTHDVLGSIIQKLKEKRIEFVSQAQGPGEDRITVYKKCLLIANKSDLPDFSEKLKAFTQGLENQFEVLAVSAFSGQGLEDLAKRIFLLLDIIRVHSKVPGKKVEYDSPYTLAKGSTVLDMAKAVHKDFAHKLKFARIWSKNKYDGQRVNRNYILVDEDVIELHI